MSGDPRERTLALLRDLQAGKIDEHAALDRLRGLLFEDLEHSTIDHDRARRTGSAEVIFGAGKTPTQVADAFSALADRGANVLATRVDADSAETILARRPEAIYFPECRLAQLKQKPAQRAATAIAVVSAGTSDAPVAEEAALTAEFYDNPVIRVVDVGVAGLHRLLARIDEIRSARVVIVVAGMEGALPSVVGGLVDKPIIAVPTSIGYGAAFDGLAALLGMLTSCASGVSVVNIDNGFGAAFQANMINRL